MMPTTLPQTPGGVPAPKPLAVPGVPAVKPPTPPTSPSQPISSYLNQAQSVHKDPVPPAPVGLPTVPPITGPAATGVTSMPLSPLGPTAPTNGSQATAAPTVPAPLPAGYTQGTSGTIGYQNFGGAGAAPLTAPTAQKYWDNATQSYQNSTINPTQTEAGSEANAAGMNDSSYMAPYMDAQGQMVNPKTGLTTTGQPLTGPGAPNPSLSNKTYNQSLASLIGPSNVMQQGATQAAALEGQTAPASAALSPGATIIGSGNTSTTTPVGSSPLTSSAATSAAASLGMPSPTSTRGSGSGYATLQATDPNNPLTAQTILPGAGTDFNSLIGKSLNAEQMQAQPYFQAALRDATRQAAASGSLGSGQLQSNIGDVANQYLNNLTAAGQQQAVQGAYQQNQNNYANLAQLTGQQQFQAGQQQNAFNNATTQSGMGFSNNPAAVNEYLSSVFGQQAGQAGQALGGLIGGTQANQTAQQQQGIQQQLYQYLFGGGNNPLGGTSTVPTLDPAALAGLLGGSIP